jgi:hypothetical protein
MKNKIKLIVSFLAVMFLLPSCLKDTVGDYWTSDLAGKAYATIPNYTIQTLVLKPSPGDVPFQFLVNIATDALPTEDITVTLAIDPTAVTQYNKDHGKNYLPFPTAQLLTPTLVIAKGTRNGYVKAKVWGAEVLDACSNFMAAISIVSATTASGKVIPIGGNMKSYFLSLPISNPYAADYHCVGYRIHPSYTDPLTVDKTETCSTIDCQTVYKLGMGDYPYGLNIQITTNTIVVSGVTCYKVVLSSPDVSSDNFGMYATYTGSSTTAPIPATPDVNYYDPIAKKFVLNYYYLSAGVPRKMYEHLTRL